MVMILQGGVEDNLASRTVCLRSYPVLFIHCNRPRERKTPRSVLGRVTCTVHELLASLRLSTTVCDVSD
jgi:hypothetical protein